MNINIPSPAPEYDAYNACLMDYFMKPQKSL